MKTFFDRVFGFSEEGGFDATREVLLTKLRTEEKDDITGTGAIVFFDNIQAGRFETPTLAQLRLPPLVKGSSSIGAQVCFKNIVGVAAALHIDPINDGAVFQAASGLNCLEFANPYGKPEDGIGCYMSDHTQGPACAIACAGGTAFRNYCTGQTRHSQLNMMSTMEQLLTQPPWFVTNGYVEAVSEEAMKAFAPTEALRDAFMVGVQYHCQCTSSPEKRIVTQVYASSCAVGYSRKANPSSWQSLACLVLEAAYEATMWVAVSENLRRERFGLPPLPVFLTKVGGGVFRNDDAWIIAAMKRAANAIAQRGYSLECHVVHYKRLDDKYDELVPVG